MPSRTWLCPKRRSRRNEPSRRDRAHLSGRVAAGIGGASPAIRFGCVRGAAGPRHPPLPIRRSRVDRQVAAGATHRDRSEPSSVRISADRAHRWPNILYASVEPQTPFVALQADLARAFPEHPLHGGMFDFSPHVAIAEGTAAESATIVGHRAWNDLSEAATARAESIELIVGTAGNWSTMWRIPLEG
jgi:2'-5' RNA ligase superfamily